MTESLKTPLRAIMEVGALYAGYLLFWGIFQAISGVELGYATHPVFVTLYALSWIGIALFNFHDELSDWRPVSDKTQARILLVLLFAFLAIFYAFILPMLPVVSAAVWWSSLSTLGGDPIFIIPKAFDIFYQQILIVTAVLAVSRVYTSVRTVSLWYAVCFGIAHLSLFLEGTSIQYAVILGAAAVLSAAIFPYLILRVKNGLVYMYALHWLFYVALALLLRL